jgi:twitching motility protein PilI
MATKEALREFQNRLNQRFQAVQATGVTAAWLAVEAKDWALLFPLSHAGEILPWNALCSVPHVKPWFLGVANLRGNLLGIIDLVEFLPVQSTSGEGRLKVHKARTENELAQCRLVAFNPILESGCALVIDNLIGLRTPSSFTRSESPAAGMPDYFGHVYIDAQGKHWQELNLQRLSLNPEFLGIGV